MNYICREIVPNGKDITFQVVNHGTTVATNAILESKGAKVALLVSEGFRDTLQVRRSHVPGGLAGWFDPLISLMDMSQCLPRIRIVWPKPEPLASLEMVCLQFVKCSRC